MILDTIIMNNINKLKYLLKRYNIKNIANVQNCCHLGKNLLRIKGNFATTASQIPNSTDKVIDTTLWNPILYAIYY